jgi:sugar/nucleoside kinase (ribokinase family)
MAHEVSAWLELINHAGCGFRPRLWESPENDRRVIQLAWENFDGGFPSIDDERASTGEEATTVMARLAAPNLRLGLLKRGAAEPLILSPRGVDVPSVWPPQ